MIIVIAFILIIIVFVEIDYKPRLDYTRDKKLLLWYGKPYRKFKILYQ
jgi:hypothetical protein